MLLGACALFGFTAMAFAEPAPETPNVRAVFKPARREGYFFVGGRYKTVGGKKLATGQMFVQFHAPPEVTQPVPGCDGAWHSAERRQISHHPDGLAGGLITSSSEALPSTSSIRSVAVARATTLRSTAPIPLSRSVIRT